MTRIAVRRAAASLLLAALWTSPALAPAQTAKEIAAAKQAFKEGEEAEAKGNLPVALARFQAALAVKATPQLHLRIGAVEEKMGRLVDALASYQRGLEKAGSLPAVAKVAKEQIDALKPRIPTVTIVVAKPPPGLVVKLDDAPLAPAALGTAVPIDPGQHRLHAEAPGYVPRDQAFAAAERGAPTFGIDLATAAPAAKPDDGGASKVPGAILTGAGAAALVAGGVLLGVSFAKDASIDKLCGGSDRLMCPLSKKAKIEADVRTVNAMRFSGIAVGVVGAAGVGAGAYLLYRAAKPKTTTGVEVVPTIGGVIVTGRF